MQTTDDSTLLRRYSDEKSEDAFGELVARHVNLVYSVALRQAGNHHKAEEITQAVFIILARKARSLRNCAALSGWLYQTARLTAANFMRSEIRRVRREQEAYMQSLLNEPAADVWPQVAPQLEDAMGALNQKDRDAIVLRYFERRSLQEVGVVCGTSENAATKRVNRAVEKLRGHLASRGITTTATALSAAITANAVQAAPAGLAATISAAALVALGISASVGVGGTAGILGTLLQACRTKLVAGIAATMLVGAAMFWLLGPQRGPAHGAASHPL